MARFIPYNYDQTKLIPINLSEHIYAGSLQEAIHLTVEKLDLSAFEKLYKNDETGRLAINPRILLKIILLAYSFGIQGSRRIELACRTNIMFMALCGDTRPDHSTIAAFIGAMHDKIMDIFLQILLVCDDLELLGDTHFSLDGLKLPSNASKEHSATFKEFKKKRGKLREKLKTMLNEHKNIDLKDIDPKEIIRAKRARQVKRIERQIARIDKFLETNQPKQGKTKKEIQSNITDNDSAKMPTSHGVIQGYNAQAIVDDKHQIIVYAEAMGNGQDTDNLVPMLEGAKQNLQAIGKGDEPLKDKILTADANYHTNKNIETCEREEVDAYIPDVKFRKRDERFKNQDRFKDGVTKPPKPGAPEKREKTGLDDFAYDEETDQLICPQGHRLKLEAGRQVMSSGVYRTYRMKDKSCTKCPIRDKCIPSKKGKHRYICVPLEPEEHELNPSQRMQRKIDTDIGKYIYGKRIGNIEPVFGNLRFNKGLDYFTYRGKDKVNVQWMLMCIVHNIEKIAHYGTGLQASPVGGQAA
jgi:transposase